MNSDNNNPYDINYYQLPIKKPWSCKYGCFSLITTGSALGIWVLASIVFCKWLFPGTVIVETNPTIGLLFYELIVIMAPIALFFACVFCVRRANRNCRDEKEEFTSGDVALVIQKVIVSCLKCALVCCVLALVTGPIAILIMFLIAMITIKKIFI